MITPESDIEREGHRRARAKSDAHERPATPRKGELAQMIVHDLRGHLTGIIGNAELIKTRTSAARPDIDRPAGAILAASRHMKRSLEDFLDVSLLAESRLTLRPEKIDLRTAAAAAVREFRDEASAAAITIELLDPGVPERSHTAATSAIVTADAGIILRVIENLVVSACRQTPSGGCVWVEVGRPAGDRVEVRVAGTGDGIPAEAPERIFEGTASGAGSGSGPWRDRGLGLAFCRMAVEAHGGTIRMETNAAGGSTIVFALPVRAGEVRQKNRDGAADIASSTRRPAS